MKDKKTKHNRLIFEFVWGLIVSILSVTLSVYCFVKFTNEWFLLLGAFSGSAAYAFGKIWLVLNEK